MKLKFSRRESRILKMMGFVILVAVLQDFYGRYQTHKQNLILDIDTKRDDLSTFLAKLQEDDPNVLRQHIEQLDKTLETARVNILELPTERDASLVVRDHLSQAAKKAGLTVRTIRSQRSTELDETMGLLELNSQLTIEGTLESLLKFFADCEQESYYIGIDMLSITARSSRSRRGRKQVDPEEQILRGTITLSTLFLPNPNKEVPPQREPGSSEATAVTQEDDILPPPDEDQEDFDFEDEETPQKQASAPGKKNPEPDRNPEKATSLNQPKGPTPGKGTQADGKPIVHQLPPLSPTPKPLTHKAKGERQ